MKNTILVLVLLSFATSAVNAQKGGILVTKYNNQKSKFINEDSKIRVKSGGKTLKGEFRTLSDSTIMVNADTILLSQITEIRYKNLSALLGGGSLLLTGAYLTAAGIYGVAMTSAEGGGIGFLLGMVIFSPFYVGGALITTGGILLLVHGKKYVPSKWKYKIARNNPVTGLY